MRHAAQSVFFSTTYHVFYNAIFLVHTIFIFYRSGDLKSNVQLWEQRIKSHQKTPNHPGIDDGKVGIKKGRIKLTEELIRSYGRTKQ